MYNGKCTKKTPHMTKRAALLVLSLVMVLSVSVGGTLAYIILQTQEVKNTFQPGEVTTTVTETFNEQEKKNVAFDNTGSNVDVYVWAKVVVNWVDSQGNLLVETPKEQLEYLISYNENGWLKGGDSYWYCRDVVEAETTSPVLITSCKPIQDQGPAGARLQVTILSQSVQATENALKDAGWAWTIPDVEPQAN